MKRRAFLQAAVSAPVAAYVPAVTNWAGLQLAMRLGVTTVRLVAPITVPPGAVIRGMTFLM